MRYTITFMNREGKSFSVCTDDESTMFEIWTMVSYAYEQVVVFDRKLDDVILVK